MGIRELEVEDREWKKEIPVPMKAEGNEGGYMLEGCGVVTGETRVFAQPGCFDMS